MEQAQSGGPAAGERGCYLFLLCNAFWSKAGLEVDYLKKFLKSQEVNEGREFQNASLSGLAAEPAPSRTRKPAVPASCLGHGSCVALLS